MKKKKKLGILTIVLFQAIIFSYEGIQLMACVGTLAPEFSCEAYVNNTVETISLADFQGKYKVLFFYPLDFTFVCPTELHAFQDRMEEFKKRDTVVMGVSVDSVHAHRAWAQQPKLQGGIEGITYPLLSDMKKSISRMYGVLDEENGVAYRGVFIIDANNVIQCSMINNMPLGRNIDEILRLIDAIRHTHESGMVCPANWQEGKQDLEPTAEGVVGYFQNQSNSSQAQV